MSAPRLLERVADLIDIPSVSHDEAAIADHLESLVAPASHLETARIGDNVLARTSLGRPLRLVLAGHLDTVPANGNASARIDGDVLWGLGAADMKGGLAVMLAVLLEVDRPAVDLTFIGYVCEEVDQHHSGLAQLARSAPEWLEADAAVLGEPTASRVEAGCQGVLRLSVTLRGERAHSARPWMGVNAIHRLAPLLNAIAGYEGRRPVIDGCEYHEALQAVSVSGGVAANVVPDEAIVGVNHRFAPDRSAEEALEAVGAVVQPVLDPSLGDMVEMVASSSSARPFLTHPLLARLVEATGEPPTAKLGWTDVSFFSARGVAACNFRAGTADARAHRCRAGGAIGSRAFLRSAGSARHLGVLISRRTRCSPCSGR